MPRLLVVLAATMAVTGCVRVDGGDPDLAPPPEPWVSALGPWSGDRLRDDDAPGELYKDEDIRDDDVGVLDYYRIPPGL
ncbi:MAG: hypothetical protein AB1918_18545 [Pseudomonadota bacterium]